MGRRTTAHEFIHPLEPAYKECVYCGERKSLVCLTCGYCYECHPAVEETERRLLATVPSSMISTLDYI